MNYNDIDIKYIKKIEYEHSFYRVLSRNSEEVKYAIELANAGMSELAIEKAIYKKFGISVYVMYKEYHKDRCEYVHISERNYEGIKVVIKYKGVEFLFECLTDGTVNRAHLLYTPLYSYGIWRDMELRTNLEDYYNDAIKLVKEDQRNIIDHFTEEINDLKKEYRKRLKKANNILNWKE